RRTAFAMMAWSVVHRKKEPAATFLHFLTLVEKHARDDRNFVKKALSWAMRSIGKRSIQLNDAALALAGKLAASTDRTERWLGKEATKELSSPDLRKKLTEKTSAGSPEPAA
ncbi:DNA alkylation repair protein, partial [Rhizobiaceae sp. 2RAB30]